MDVPASPRCSGGDDATVAGAGRERGRLLIYLGATPGSGKTFTMLRVGRERRGEGEDVVVGFVEAHGRPLTIAAVGTLEVVPRLRVEYRGREIEDMDVDGVLARKPAIALVDELAHTNVPGMRNEKRWQDVEELRGAGIDVVTTLNVQHIESVKDLVEHITQIPVRETVPDAVIDGATEVQFIDISPEALRKRMRHGNIYAPDKVETALGNFFRPGNLAALREIAMRLIADSVGQSVGRARGRLVVPQDVLVAVSPRESSDPLIRRGARLARRFEGLCSVVLARQPERPVDNDAVERLRRVASTLNCPFVEREGRIEEVIERSANELGVRHLVVGEEAPRPLLQRLRGGVVDAVIDRLPEVNVHVVARVAHPSAPSRDQEREPERPDADALLRALNAPLSRRGRLRLYLGYARGVGTTTAMLEEGRRRHRRGTDVVVAAVRTPGRATCVAPLGELEILGGPGSPALRARLDTAMLLRRNPEVACVDDLEGLTITGRAIITDIPAILDAGISVVATLHLASLRSVREGMGRALGPAALEQDSVPDAFLDMADEVELVDVTPATLDARLRQGEIVSPARAASALQHEFRPSVLGALRETAFRVIAGHTDRQLLRYMHDRRIERPWEARSRVMLCVPPRQGMEPIIRRAARLALHVDAAFDAVTVRDRERSVDEKARLGRYAALTHQLGGDFTTLYNRRIAATLADHARRILATEVVVIRGERRHGRRTVRELIRILSDVDIHILSTGEG